jgi:hypothetical protein
MAKRSAPHVLAGLALGGLAIIAVLPSFAGCGGASNGYSAFASDAGPSAAGNDATMSGTSGGSSGSSSGDDSEGQCVTGCTSDEQCQTSCPPAPNGGTNCCDVPSGTCMAMTGACPGPSDSGVE